MHANASKPCRALRPSASRESVAGAGVRVRTSSHPGPALFGVALIPFARLAPPRLASSSPYWRNANSESPKKIVSCTLQGITRNRNLSVALDVPFVLSLVIRELAGLIQSGVSFSLTGLGDPVLMADEKKSRWKVPLGLVATGVAGAAVLVLRGCWHRKMSWPVRAQNHSYQVCLGCGIKRLFDEKLFRAYGPYSYDLTRLIGWDDQRAEREAPQRRPA